ncbi:MAG: guanylate kinase [Planctomycetes bacterium]|nr:guanylate kinase [Planctomycetota bacterium]MBI3844892.1 guanylate kinase [Planctomycetota bacterium]
MRNSPAGVLVAVSGPSGAGKSTVVDALLSDPRFARAVTATTRPPRANERNGVDYEFMSEEAFERGARAGDFLEHARVYQRRYGTPRRNVERVLASGKHCLLVVDVQGVDNLRRASVPALTVFVEPPSREVLEQRLRERGTDSEEQLHVRLETADREMMERDKFDLRVVNDDVTRAAAEIRDWVLRKQTV